MYLLEVTIDPVWFWVIGIIVLSFAIGFLNEIASLRKSNRERKAEYLRIENDLKLNVTELALKQYEVFKATALETERKIITDNATNAALNLLDRWKIDNTEIIRKDAVKRSMAVNLGKITEHLIPFSDQFNKRNFSPQDCRFIGSPVDLIVFDGASPHSEKGQVTIYFIEVKTGKSALKEGQRLVKEAVIAKRVEWLELKKGEFSWQTES